MYVATHIMSHKINDLKNVCPVKFLCVTPPTLCGRFSSNFKWDTYLCMAVNPFSAGTVFMLMQTGWIQASRRVTRRLAWDPTCLLLSPQFPIKIKQNFKVLRSRRQYNLFLENYPAFKGLILPKFWHRQYYPLYIINIMLPL